MVLHRDKRCQVVGDGVVLHREELVCIARAHSNVANVARFDNIVQSLHRFFDRCLRVEAMALEDVNVVEIEPFQTSLDAVKDVLPTEACLVSAS